MTVGKDDVRFISGPPRVFDGKVIIGHGGADVGSIRGYVTAYDAETGKQPWRFWTVPGQPGVDDAEPTPLAKRKSVGEGKGVSVRGDLGGPRKLKKKKRK